MSHRGTSLAKLKEQDLLLLRIVEMAPKISVVELARRLSTKVHRVRYELQLLENKNIIQRTIPVFNPNLIGYSEYFMYFSLNNPKAAVREQFLKHCMNIPGLSWLTPSGGPFEYFASFCLPDLSALAKILASVSNKFELIFKEKTIAQLISFNFYGKKYLHPSSVIPSLCYAVSSKKRMLEEVEKKVLTVLEQQDQDSLRKLATVSGVSVSTLLRKISQFESEGIIVGYTKRINTARLGIQSYKLIFNSADSSDNFYSSFEQYCARHAFIVSLSRCIGAWDYDIRIELPATENPALVVQELKEHFSKQLFEYKLIPLYQPLRMNNFPYAVRQ